MCCTGLVKSPKHACKESPQKTAWMRVAASCSQNCSVWWLEKYNPFFKEYWLLSAAGRQIILTCCSILIWILIQNPHKAMFQHWNPARRIRIRMCLSKEGNTPGTSLCKIALKIGLSRGITGDKLKQQIGISNRLLITAVFFLPCLFTFFFFKQQELLLSPRPVIGRGEGVNMTMECLIFYFRALNLGYHFFPLATIPPLKMSTGRIGSTFDELGVLLMKMRSNKCSLAFMSRLEQKKCSLRSWQVNCNSCWWGSKLLFCCLCIGGFSAPTQVNKSSSVSAQSKCTCFVLSSFHRATM